MEAIGKTIGQLGWYWLWIFLISAAVAAYVWGLMLRKESRNRQIWGTVLAGVISFIVLLVLGMLLGPNVLRDWPLLSIVTFFPLAGAIVVLLLPKERADWIRWTSLLLSLVPLALSIVLWVAVSQSSKAGMHFVERAEWIQAIGIYYQMGVDGISVPMIFLTALLTTLAVIYSFIVQDRPKEYYAFFLILEMAMIGVFVALNFFLFYIFWELSLVPMYFLIGLWGAPPRKEGRIVRGGPYAAIKFFIYTLAGSVFILLAILAIYFSMQGRLPNNGSPFDITALTEYVAQGGRLFDSPVMAGLVF